MNKTLKYVLSDSKKTSIIRVITLTLLLIKRLKITTLYNFLTYVLNKLILTAVGY